MLCAVRHEWSKRGVLRVMEVHGRAIVVCWKCGHPDVESASWWRHMKRTEHLDRDWIKVADEPVE